jgi:hypothetical protein
MYDRRDTPTKNPVDILQMLSKAQDEYDKVGMLSEMDISLVCVFHKALLYQVVHQVRKINLHLALVKLICQSTN